MKTLNGVLNQVVSEYQTTIDTDWRTGPRLSRAFVGSFGVVTSRLDTTMRQVPLEAFDFADKSVVAGVP